MEIAQIFEDHKHVIFNDVISKETADLLTAYMFTKKEANLLKPPNQDPQVPRSWTIYGDPLFDTLLTQYKDILGHALGKSLVPAYTYARIYEKGSVLKKHVDRASCELSATLTLGMSDQKHDWPIWIDYKGVETPISIPVGSMLFYKGHEVEHWREEFTGDWQCQVFLHFVDGHGQYRESNKFDGRPALGLSIP